ncbi:hypothetical protein AABB24_000141 [Solanum stoloniferum]|uniref:MAR-binding protein n=1 Tax=Solanum stoloniferum TaxID=62892 RepID=A0ABD2VDY0_9SOLN
MVLKLKSFSKFEVENTSEALSEVMLLINSKPNKGLRKFLKAHCDGETLVVADSKLGNAIKEKLQVFQNILLHQSTTQNVCCHQATLVLSFIFVLKIYISNVCHKADLSSC